ncbi:MAG TPA: hypothetical protein VM266_10375 [Solirubrobacteraceae bacterium]|nr:hypothetical protein [Solirubrobacteraceae bacterium]
MSLNRLVPLAVMAGALVLPGAASAGTAVDAACDAYVWVGEGSVRHGTYEVRTPEQTIRLGDHTGALGEQDPCAG